LCIVGSGIALCKLAATLECDLIRKSQAGALWPVPRLYLLLHCDFLTCFGSRCALMCQQLTASVHFTGGSIPSCWGPSLLFPFAQFCASSPLGPIPSLSTIRPSFIHHCLQPFSFYIPLIYTLFFHLIVLPFTCCYDLRNPTRKNIISSLAVVEHGHQMSFCA